MCPIFGIAEDEVVLSEEQTVLMQALGLEDYKAMDAEAITRGEAAHLLALAVFGEIDEDNSYTEEQIFSDIDGNSQLYNEILLLKSIGVIKGESNGSFNPFEYISVDHALTMVTRVLHRNLDENGSDFKRLKNEFLSGTKISDGSKLTLSNAFIIIYNLMNTRVYGSDYGSAKAPLYMEYQRSIYKVSGIVTDDGRISSVGRSVKVSNEIVINEKVYTNNTNETDLFGYDVIGFYYDDGIATLLSVTKSKRNNETFIYSEDIESYTPASRTYEYYSSESAKKVKKISLNTDITVVYNGVTLGINDTEFLPEMFRPVNGTVKFLDNNKDGKSDVVFIYNYETGIISAVDVQKESIYFKFEAEPLELADAECTFYDKDRNIISLEEITENAVLSYAMSMDRESVEAFVVNNITEDICASISKDKKLITTKTGGEYTISDYCISRGDFETLQLGKRYSFYFDIFDRVTQIIPVADKTWSVAYLEQTAQAAEFLEEYYVKLSGIGEKSSVYSLADHVQIYKQDNTEQRYKKEVAYQYLSDYCVEAKAKFNGYATLVRFKTDINNKITEIEMPVWQGVDISEIEEDRLHIICDSSGAGVTYMSSGHFEAACAIDESTVAMAVLTGDDETASLNKSDFSNNQTYKIIAYSTTPGSLIADYLTVVDGGQTTLNFNVNYFTVEEIAYVYNEEESDIVAEMKGYEISSNSINEKSYFVKDKTLLKNVKDFTGREYEVSRGDILYVSVSSKKDSINGMYMIYDADGVGSDGKGTFGCKQGILAGAAYPYYTGNALYGNPYGFIYNKTNNAISVSGGLFKTNDRIMLGFVYKTENNAITVTTQPIGNKQYTSLYDRTQYFTEVLPGISSKIIKISNTDRETRIEKAALADAKGYTEYSNECSKVLIIQHGWGTVGICLIED